MADDAFSWIRSLSSDTEEKSQAIVNLYLNLPCGLLRGALSGLGYDARVTVELKRFPECMLPGQHLIESLHDLPSSRHFHGSILVTLRPRVQPHLAVP